VRVAAAMQTPEHVQLAGGGGFVGQDGLHMPHSGVGQDVLHMQHSAAHLQALMQMGAFGGAGGAGPLGMGLAQHNVAAMVLAQHAAAVQVEGSPAHRHQQMLLAAMHSAATNGISQTNGEEGPEMNEGDSWNDGEMASGSEDEGGLHEGEEGIEDDGNASWMHSDVRKVSSFDGASPNSTRPEKIVYKKAKRAVYIVLKEVSTP
jgi:hypothetical protein